MSDTAPTFEIFIVHSFDDMSLVGKIYEGFKDFPRIQLLIAEWEKRPGELLTDKIEELIRRCHVVIVVWTHYLEKSVLANQEIGYARALDKRIFPFVVRGINPKGFLQGMEYIDYDPFNIEKDVQNLVETVRMFAQRLGYAV